RTPSLTLFPYTTLFRSLVEHLAVRRQAPVEVGPVPGGRADGGVFLVEMRNIGLARHLVGLADMVASTALGDRLAVGNDLRARSRSEEHTSELQSRENLV